MSNKKRKIVFFAVSILLHISIANAQTKTTITEKTVIGEPKIVSLDNNVVIGKNTQSHSLNFHFENERHTPEVASKMNFNKTHQRPLSEGILKSYKVQISSCNSEANTKKIFSFLNNTEGFVKVDFISSGLVNLLVVPEYNSVDLKDMMLSRGMTFNFISETYFLK
jgi:hypothetical protein